MHATTLRFAWELINKFIVIFSILHITDDTTLPKTSGSLSHLQVDTTQRLHNFKTPDFQVARNSYTYIEQILTLVNIPKTSYIIVSWLPYMRIG